MYKNGQNKQYYLYVKSQQMNWGTHGINYISINSVSMYLEFFFIDFSTALFEQILFHLPIKVDYNRTDGGKQQKKR